MADKMEPPTLDEQKHKKKVKPKKLTKAERRAIAKVRLTEANKNRIRDHLKRELEFTETSYERGFRNWVELCREMKLIELQKDVDYLWASLNRVMDAKNYRIKLLLDALDLAEEQHQQSFSDHANFIEYLMKYLQHSLESMKCNYEREAASIVKDFLIENNAVEEVKNSKKDFYESLGHAGNLLSINKLSIMKKSFEEEKTDIIDSNIAARYDHKEAAMAQIKGLFKEYKDSVASIKQQDMWGSKQKGRKMTETQKDLLNEHQRAAELEEIENLLEKGQNTIFVLQKELNMVENLNNAKLMELRNERKYFVEQYWRMKEHSKKYQDNNDQLSFLASEAYKIIQFLTEKCEYGSFLLGIAKSCRKLLTEKEKVVPWPEPHEINSLLHTFEDKKINHMNELEFFWYRLCRIKSHVILLKEDKKQLEAEKAFYCDTLKKSFAGVIRTTVVSDPSQNNIPSCNNPEN